MCSFQALPQTKPHSDAIDLPLQDVANTFAPEVAACACTAQTACSLSVCEAQLQLGLLYNTDAAATATVNSIFCADLSGICISLGVSGTTDKIAPN